MINLTFYDYLVIAGGIGALISIFYKKGKFYSKALLLFIMTIVIKYLTKGV